MSTFRSSRQFAAWLASLALLLGALAPAVAEVSVAARDGARWVQICGAGGVAWVQLDAERAAEPAGSDEHPGEGARHCPWCSLDGPAGLPPLSWRLAVLEHALALSFSGQALLAARTEWPSALSRAPPSA